MAFEVLQGSLACQVFLVLRALIVLEKKEKRVYLGYLAPEETWG